MEGVKRSISHESFSNFNFSIDRVGQHVALPSNLSRPSVSRLSRSGPFTRKTWTSKRSAHGFLSNRYGIQVSSLNLYPRCRGRTASMEINGSREGERER